LIKEYSDLKKLSIRDPLKSPRMLDRIKAVELYQSKAAKQYPILGWVEGAFAQANDLRGMTDLMTDIYMEPAFVHELLDICIEQEIAFAREQIKAGADFIGIGDAAASLVGPLAYKEMALPYEKRLVEEIHSMGAAARLHICGNTGKLLELMPLTGADIIDVDWMVDFGRAVEAFGIISACGNFDPVSVVLQGNAGSVKEAVRSCISRASNNTFIAAGCEIPRDTPYENMAAISEALEEAAH
jgi:uroporphyrinogen decarboxylase